MTQSHYALQQQIWLHISESHSNLYSGIVNKNNKNLRQEPYGTPNDVRIC